MNKNMNVQKFQHILVAVDDSSDAKLAFNYAIYRAKITDSVLDIATILEDDDFNVYEVLSKDYMDEKRDKLKQQILQYKQLATDAGVKEIHTYVAEGDDPAGEIIVKRLIPDIKPDLLIIGSKSTTGVEKYLGSQASYMVKHAPVSVLVVR